LFFSPKENNKAKAYASGCSLNFIVMRYHLPLVLPDAEVCAPKTHFPLFYMNIAQTGFIARPYQFDPGLKRKRDAE